jgi:hypothetical protein
VDEFVYISAARLRGLLPEEPRAWARLRARRIQAGVEASGLKLGAELEPDERIRLARHVDEAEKHAHLEGKWYQDESVEAGDWIFFEGRIGCHVVDMGPGSTSAVLFCEVPSGRGRTVVLHGSAKHLTDAPHDRPLPVSITAPPHSSAGAFPRVVQRAVATQGDPLWAFWNRLRDTPSRAVRELAVNVTELHARVVDTTWFKSSAPNLAGCGVVSGLVPGPNGEEVVVGSPLVIRRRRPGN